MKCDLEIATFDFFRQISAIPRESGYEQDIQKYLVAFAIQRKLPYYQDEFGNVIIYKQTAAVEPIILQAHTDMVCVKTTRSKHDFRRDPIRLVTKGRYLQAKDTSLGADDGIGVAMILAILDAPLPCNVEAVFTASEETTMRGAYQLDVTKLKAKKLICLDGFENNTIVTSCASFTDYLVTLPQPKQVNNLDIPTFDITLSGVPGGHSGFNIAKNRGNSHQLIAELLAAIPDAGLCALVGGHNFNVIPSKTCAVIQTAMSLQNLRRLLKDFCRAKQVLYPQLKIVCQKNVRGASKLPFGNDLLPFIREFQNGVIRQDHFGNVLVSQNLSEIDTLTGQIKIGIRSNLPGQENILVAALNTLCQKYRFDGKVVGFQPGFNTLAASTLFDDLQTVNSQAREVKMHIGVECGVLQSRIKDLDAVIISPTIINAHSTAEKLVLATVKNTVNWLKDFLALRIN